MKVVSEGDNLHEMPITRDAVISSAETIIGKPILFKFNRSTQDLMGHEIDEIACGVCALTKDDYYFKEIDEKLWLVVKAYIWKIYFEDVVDVFERDEEKALSMEMFIVDSEELANDGTLITSFCFTGITLIGNKYTPAIQNAGAKVTKYTKETFFNMVQETKKMMFSNNTLNKELTTDTTKTDVKEEIILKNFNKKEFLEKYSITANAMFEMLDSQFCKYTDDYGCKKYYVNDFCNKYAYVYDWESSNYKAVPYIFENKEMKVDMENAKFAMRTYEVIEEDEKTLDDINSFSEKQMISERIKVETDKLTNDHNKKIEKYTKDIEAKDEKINKLTEEKKNLEKNKETFDTEKTELDEKIVNYEKEIENLKTEKESLVDFKSKIEKQEKENKINYAIQTVKDSLTEEQIKEWSEKVKDFDSVEQFTNAIQAFAYTQVKDIPKDHDTEMRIHIPNDSEAQKEKGLWD